MKTCNFPTIKALSLLTAAVTGMILTAGSLADTGKGRTKAEASASASKPAETVVAKGPPKGMTSAPETGKKRNIEPQGGIAAASCGGTEITQNTDFTVVAGTVSCNAGGIPADNFYARAYVMPPTATNVNCVDFGVELNNAVGAAPVRVRLYSTSVAAPGVPTTASLTQLGSDVVVSVPANTNLAILSANFVPAVTVPANTRLVVELFQADRDVAAGGDGGSLFLGSNAAGQSGPTYIKAADCGLTDYGDMAGIGFPNVHILQRMGTTAAGPPCQQPLPFCAWDIAPAGGNGAINIDDLLGVINSWTTGVPDPNGPRPLGDIAPPPNGNCIVNIDDLLAVINHWGNCPTPTGACCAFNGSCSELTAADCATAGGDYHGNFSLCANTVCPIHDSTNCADAIALTIDGAPVCEDLATALPVAAGVPPCGSAFNNVRWYTVIGTGSIMTAETCGGPATTDTQVSVFCGNNCSGLTCVDANDDICGLQSSVSFCSALGQKYWIVVTTAPSATAGPFCIKVMDTGVACTTTLVCGPPPAPANDECAGATEITCGSTNTVTAAQYVTYTAAASDPDSTCEIAGGGPFTKDASWWYKITTGATQTSLNLSLCSSAGGTTMDTVLSVLSGSCGALTQVACDDDFCTFPAFGPSQLCATVTPNTTYLILVDHYAAADPADYTLVVDCVTDCPAGPEVPVNDECAGALPVFLGDNNVTDAGATASNPLPPGGACSFNGPAVFGKDVWFTFTNGPVAGAVVFETSLTVPPVNDTVISVLTGTCASLTEIGCDDDSSPNGLLSLVTVNLAANQQVFVRVSSWNTSPTGPIVLTISGGVAPPANDECAGATPVVSGVNNISNAGSTQGGSPTPASCTTNGKDVWYTFTQGPVGGNVTFDTSATVAPVTDTVLNVYSGACGALTQVGCDDDSGTGNMSLLTVNLAANTTYYVRVSSWNASATGPIVLTITP